MIAPLPSRTVRVTQTFLPSCAYSWILRWPGLSSVVVTVLVVALMTSFTMGVVKVTLRPVGTL